MASGFPSPSCSSMQDKKAVIFCSASYKIDPKYNQVARKVIRAACLHGYGIVSGGTVKGTMGVICDEAAKYGVPVEGVLPKFMKGLEHPSLTSLKWTERMSERKDAMREGTCLAIALPGGIGTIDELIETMTLAKLGKYPGRLVAFNIDGFYNPLKAMLDHFVETGMLEQKDRDLMAFPETVEELEALL